MTTITWRDLHSDHTFSDQKMSLADLEWSLRYAAMSAVGWARNAERRGEERGGDFCRFCGRGEKTSFVPYTTDEETRAWAMVALHVRVAVRAAWYVARERSAPCASGPERLT